MAKLIKEEVSEVNFLTEMNNGKKEHYITGIFMQAEQKNKNGRVYPMHILRNEVERYNKDYIKKNRAFGELGHPDCFHDKTELLTVNDGWKLIKDVSVGEDVYTLNPDTNKVEVQKVTKVTNEPFSGEMISFNGRGLKTKVTPNHRFIVNTRGKLRFVTAQEALDNNLSHSFVADTPLDGVSLTSSPIYLDKRFMTIEKEHYEGTIHCITVDNGTFYARDEGYTFWTGNSPTINLDRVSHMITSLSPEGTNFMGKAKILDTPNGQIVKSLLDGGANLGVSTRGVGTLKPQSGVQLVQDDFHLATAADIVADPSAPDAWVTGVMESAEWVLTNTGWTSIQYEKARTMIKEASKSEIEDVALKLWTNYISKL